MGLYKAKAQRAPEAEGPPPWLVRYYLAGELPERGTVEWDEFTKVRYFSRLQPGTEAYCPVTLEALIARHLVELQAEADRQAIDAWYPRRMFADGAA